MTKQDLKKNDHAEVRHEIAEDIVSIRNLKSFSQEKKEELIKELLAKKELTQTPLEKVCPYPQHKWYAELWKSLTPEQQKEMKENIKVTTDWKIEIIKMKKKFSILTAQHNGKDIFDGDHKDKDENTGMKWVTYLTGQAAKRESINQGKKLLKDKSEVEQIISYFSWRNTKEKIFNFVKLFGLEKAGYWNPFDKKWFDVGSLGYVLLSEVYDYDYVYGVLWNKDVANINRNDRRFLTPCLSCEDLD